MVEFHPHGEDERVPKTDIYMGLEDIAKCEKIKWRRRSRVLWIKQGDKKPSFFKMMANARKRYNSFNKIEMNGVTSEKLEDIKREILCFYQNLYSETEDWRPRYNIEDSYKITEEENLWLQRPFEEMDAIHVIK